MRLEHRQIKRMQRKGAICTSQGNDRLGSDLLRWLARSKSPLLVELRDPALVITERITQDLLGVLAQQWSSHRINRAGQAHGNRRLDVRDPLCRTMWNPVQAMALSRLRRIEPLLYRPEIADRDIRQLHLGHPVLEGVACKDLRDGCS